MKRREYIFFTDRKIFFKPEAGKEESFNIYEYATRRYIGSATVLIKMLELNTDRSARTFSGLIQDTINIPLLLTGFPKRFIAKLESDQSISGTIQFLS